ncbi:MAG: PP2C family protein-serine/threonine phosphatase [Acidobacteriota bacterium]|nr:PP2C family protein-serine/threonine phosphatase [Acidobacteriota bacterium]
MAPNFPNAADVKLWLRKVLRPKTKLGKTTLWFGSLALLLELLKLVTRSPQGTMLSGWASFLVFVFAACGCLVMLRWVRRQLMWRLRNRLIVTYVFIGVIPIVLLVSMALLAGYLFAGQFATYVAAADVQSELQHLESANKSMAAQLRSLSRAGKLNEQIAAEIASASAENFRQRTVTVWEGERSFLLPPERRDLQVITPPDSVKGDFAGAVIDGNRLYLRVVRRLEENGRPLTVISNVPMTPELLRQASSQLGSVTLLLPEEETAPKPPLPQKSFQIITPKSQSNDTISFEFGDTRSRVKLGQQPANGPQRVDAGHVPPPANSLDFQFPFATRFNAVDWKTGKTLTGLMVVETRPSLLYGTLFSTLGEKSGIFLDSLLGIAIFFALIELVALIIGMRLTRSMTKSVAELYSATEHVNRGDLGHRIRVRSRDQMAALEHSFNSMTESLAKLIAEQKEKQRLEGELAIAHEVQTLLFPADLSGLQGLEVHGVCRPARTVSGDYYDFIPLHEDRLVLAVGDISGKGISAALLMATVHAFVRAYSLEPERTLASVALAASPDCPEVLPMKYRNATGDSQLCPGVLMATLNYQLYRSTPTEKYATMFLGCYDAAQRSLIYSNAGHLPPLVLGGDGRITRLETSGTVVGLFDGMSYDESTVGMESGDIFVAYSDGVTEPENEFGEFGEGRLIELIQRHRDEPLSRISDIVTSAVTDWIAGGEQPDDITLVLARAR